jgi:hypothetical protein
MARHSSQRDLFSSWRMELLFVVINLAVAPIVIAAAWDYHAIVLVAFIAVNGWMLSTRGLA